MLSRETAIKGGAGIVVIAIAFASGRYTVPTKIEIKKEIQVVEKKVEVEKQQTQSDTDRNKHKETVVVEVVRPDGTKETTIRTIEDTNTKRLVDTRIDRQTTDQIAKQEKDTTTKVSGAGKVNLSLLAGVPFTSPGTLIYGGQISKPILGPITAGVWGMSNGTAGVSVGLQF